MRIVKLKGGLGNQMFQYCFAKLVQSRTKETVKLDLSAFGDLQGDPIRVPRILKFKLSLPVASRREIQTICKIQHTGNSQTLYYRGGIAIEKLINPLYYFELDRAYRNPKQILPGRKYYDGYWQSWRYVAQVWDAVQTDFQPKRALSQQTLALADQMQQEQSVFVGVRRGDYSLEASHYGCFGQAYYDKAMRYIETQVQHPVYYIFSNDIDWVRKHLNFRGRQVIYREKEQIVDDFEEMFLMASCQSSIIVSSTYHWWGSRLNDHEDKIVVAPRNWFSDGKPIDIVPNHWIRI